MARVNSKKNRVRVIHDADGNITEPSSWVSFVKPSAITSSMGGAMVGGTLGNIPGALIGGAVGALVSIWSEIGSEKKHTVK